MSAAIVLALAEDRTKPRQLMHTSCKQEVIHRARLLEDLAAVNARTILLVAPAGYGKTTLALQWLEQVRGVRLALTEASLDVTVLGRLIAVALAQLKTLDQRRIDAVLSIGRTPAEQARMAAVTILSQFKAPIDDWLVIDDYHVLTRSRAAEELVAALERSQKLNLMIVSRDRPLWATSRRFVHHELVEFGAPDLVLDEAEIAQLLPPEVDAAAIREQARGWPAALALAARLQSRGELVSPTLWVESLYDYFASEIFEMAGPPLRHLLASLAVLPTVTIDDVREFVGPFAPIDQALATGFIQRADQYLDVHPLARAFLVNKARERQDFEDLIDKSCDMVLAKHLWNDAFNIITQFGLHDRLEELIVKSFETLVATGCLATLETFGKYAARHCSVSQTTLDLITAEGALRDGNYARALAMAEAVIGSRDDSDPLKPRAFCVAGEAARLSHDHKEAWRLYTCGNTIATRPRDLNTAAWGRCLAAINVRNINAEQIVAEFERAHRGEPENRLRVLTARYILARLKHGFKRQLVDEQFAATLVEATCDPRIRAGWLNAHGYALVLQGRYASAQHVLRDALCEIDQAGLAFARPHVEGTLALAEMGLRHFSRCDGLIRRIEADARESGDCHLRVNARILRARLCLTERRFGEAREVMADDCDGALGQAVHGEYLATRALVLALCGDEDWRDVGQGALGVSEAVEARVLVATARAIAQRGSEDEAEVNEAVVETAESLETWDGVICGLRADGEWLRALAAMPRHRAAMERVFVRADDDALLRAIGRKGRSRARRGPLSTREQEVLDLIRAGLKTREIAETLYIGTSTVKSHVDSILAKLGAGTRAEAVSRYAEMAAETGRVPNEAGFGS